MTEYNPVTTLSQNGHTVPIGAKDEHIYLYETVINSETHEEETICVGTLHDFLLNWEDFKQNNNFIYTGNAEPTNVQQIKVWYKTAGENN